RAENAQQVGDKLVDENGEVIQEPQPVVEKTYDRTLYIVGATREQLKSLADYMKANGIAFRGEK
ncbi:MAG TPA: replication protein, partial [Leuconostoc lactis]|nr:replication protein [Leuconostoc lactis]